MNILYVEDTSGKYMDVCGALKSSGLGAPVWKKNLEDALFAIDRAKKDGRAFDVILTDMEYPLSDGGAPKGDAGEHLIEALRNEGVETPVIVISSVNYRGNPPAGAKAAIFYRERDSAWQRELVEAIRRIV